MNNQFVMDCHMHTLASGHAFGTIREMARAASEMKLEMIGITEHGPGIPGTCELIYFQNLSRVPKVLDGVRVLHGVEANLDRQGNLLFDDNYCKDLQYMIVGIHCVNNLYSDQGIEKNTDNLIQCMKHPLVHFISHPDTNATPLNYERLVKAAKENEVALEINESSLLHTDRRPGCIENYKKMLDECTKYRCPIIIDSDAHDPSELGHLELSKKFVDDYQFDYDLILNTSTDKFKDFIHLQD